MIVIIIIIIIIITITITITIIIIIIIIILENCDRRQKFTERFRVITLPRNVDLVQVKRTVNDAAFTLTSFINW